MRGKIPQENSSSPDNNFPAPAPPAKREKNKEFVLFGRVQEALGYLPDFMKTCEAILDALMEGIDAENCSIMLQDPASGELSILAARGKNEDKSIYYPDFSFTGARFKAGEGMAGWVLKEGQALMANDTKSEPRFVQVDGLKDHVRSLICFPIREKDQVVGVFNLSHSKKGAFKEADKLALGYISTQVGAALTSARFFIQMNEIDRLMKDTEGVKVSPAASSATFVEVGEMMMAHERGIFIYASEKMQRVKEIIDQVANTDVTILIQGESGVGKEVVARSIHLNSQRRDKPFVKVNCAALPSELLESELFGYERGAFTGAYRQKPGKFELAHGGTIFLDEITEISLGLQAKLLQVLQDREFSRLGGKKDIRVDVRILGATNKNVEEAVKTGHFREDLYYRFNVVNITIPPLRERVEEIPVFVEYFLNKFSKKYQKTVKSIPPSLMKVILRHHWPGNVRELENAIQRFVVLGNETDFLSELVPEAQKEIPSVKTEDGMLPKGNPVLKGNPALKEVHRQAVLHAEGEAIQQALELTNWNRKKAAKLLKISYKSLLNKIKQCAIRKSPFPRTD